jgi:MarR family 2-MHQ and catechol resistance regulon transcriptional repressor
MAKQAEHAEPTEEGNATYNSIISTYKLLQRGMTLLLADEGLTQPQFGALRAVARHGQTPMKTLSEELLVTAPNITGIVDRLESKRLLRRVASREDRRTTMVELTPRGMKLLDRLTKKYVWFIKTALQEFSAKEQEMLCVLLARLQDELSRLDSEVDHRA